MSYDYQMNLGGSWNSCSECIYDSVFTWKVSLGSLMQEADIGKCLWKTAMMLSGFHSLADSDM